MNVKIFSLAILTAAAFAVPAFLPQGRWAPRGGADFAPQPLGERTSHELFLTLECQEHEPERNDGNNHQCSLLSEFSRPFIGSEIEQVTIGQHDNRKSDEPW